MTRVILTPACFITRMIAFRGRLYFLRAVSWALIYFTPLLPGLAAHEYFDTLTGTSTLGLSITVVLVLVLLAGLSRVVASQIAALIDHPHGFQVTALLRRNLFHEVFKRPGAAALTESSGEALSRINDDVDQSYQVIDWTIDLIGIFLFGTSAIVIMSLINWQITLVVFAPLVLVVAIVQRSSKRLQTLRAASREAAGAVAGSLGDMFETVQVIQVNGAEDRVIGRFRMLNERRRSATVKDKLAGALIEVINSGIVNFGTGIILLVGANAVSNGTFTVGDFSLFVYYLGFVSWQTSFWGTFVAQVRQAQVSLGRMSALAKSESPEALITHHDLHIWKAPTQRQPITQLRRPLQKLTVSGLTYRYPNANSNGEAARAGIVDINLSLQRGSFTAITGVVGSGKTTLLRALLGLLPKDSGEVRWNDEVIDDLAEFFVPPNSAYTPQVPRLFSETLRNNILLGRSDPLPKLEASVRDAMLGPDIAQLEAGLDTLIGPRGVKLSGGQIQRAAAARMFIRDAELVVIDDLSSALDVETERALWQRVKMNRRAGITYLVTSHRQQVLAMADTVILLHAGHIVAQGHLSDLLAASPDMQRLWREITRSTEATGKDSTIR